MAQYTADARHDTLEQKQMQRHRLIYSTLKAELDAGLHALIIKAKTPLEAGEVQTAPASGAEGVPAGP